MGRYCNRQQLKKREQILFHICSTLYRTSGGFGPQATGELDSLLWCVCLHRDFDPGCYGLIVIMALPLIEWADYRCRVEFIRPIVAARIDKDSLLVPDLLLPTRYEQVWLGILAITSNVAAPG